MYGHFPKKKPSEKPLELRIYEVTASPLQSRTVSPIRTPSPPKPARTSTPPTLEARVVGSSFGDEVLGKDAPPGAQEMVNVSKRNLVNMLEFLKDKPVDILSAQILDINQPREMVIDPVTFKIKEATPGIENPDASLVNAKNMLVEPGAPLDIAFLPASEGRAPVLFTKKEVKTIRDRYLGKSDGEIYAAIRDSQQYADIQLPTIVEYALSVRDAYQATLRQITNQLHKKIQKLGEEGVTVRSAYTGIAEEIINRHAIHLGKEAEAANRPLTDFIENNLFRVHGDKCEVDWEGLESVVFPDDPITALPKNTKETQEILSEGEEPQLKQTQEHVEEAVKALSLVTEENDELKKELETLKRELEAAKKQGFDAQEELTKQVTGLKTEKDELQKQLTAARNKIEDLEQDKKDLAAENEGLKEGLQTLQTEADERAKNLEQRLDALQTEKDNVTLERDTAQNQRDNLQARANAQVTQIQTLTNENRALQQGLGQITTMLGVGAGQVIPTIQQMQNDLTALQAGLTQVMAVLNVPENQVLPTIQQLQNEVTALQGGLRQTMGVLNVTADRVLPTIRQLQNDMNTLAGMLAVTPDQVIPALQQEQTNLTNIQTHVTQVANLLNVLPAQIMPTLQQLHQVLAQGMAPGAPPRPMIAMAQQLQNDLTQASAILGSATIQQLIPDLQRLRTILVPGPGPAAPGPQPPLVPIVQQVVNNLNAVVNAFGNLQTQLGIQNAIIGQQGAQLQNATGQLNVVIPALGRLQNQVLTQHGQIGQLQTDVNNRDNQIANLTADLLLHQPPAGGFYNIGSKFTYKGPIEKVTRALSKTPLIGDGVDRRHFRAEGSTEVMLPPAGPLGVLTPSAPIPNVDPRPTPQQMMILALPNNLDTLRFHWLPDGPGYKMPRDSVIGYIPAQNAGDLGASFLFHDSDQNQIIRVPESRLGPQGVRELHRALLTMQDRPPYTKHGGFLTKAHGAPQPTRQEKTEAQAVGLKF